MNVHNRPVRGTIAWSAMLLTGCTQWSGTPVNADGGYEYRNRDGAALSVAGDDRAVRIAALEQERQRLSEALAAEQQKNAGLGSQAGRIGDLERQLTARDQELAALQGNLSSGNREITRLKGQVGQGQAGVEELTRTKDQLASLTGTLSKRDHKIAQLKASLDQQNGNMGNTERDLLTSLRPEIAKGFVTVQQAGDRLTIHLSSQALFESGRDTVKGAGVDILKRVSTVLKGFPESQVQVDGHTDNVAIQGALLKKFPTNQALSKSRAVNAMRILEQGGVPSKRLESTGYADTKPVASNDSEAGRQKNRRVEIVVSQLRDQSFKSF